MNLSENQKVVDDLKQILEYYDYLEYDENLSAGTDQLCLKVSDPDANCHLGVIKNICAQLGSEYTCEPGKSTRFYIRLKDHNDYPLISTSQHQEERLHPEPDSATAYYYRGLVKSYMGQYESAIEDYSEARRLSTARDKLYAMVLLHQLLAKKEEDQSNRIRFYCEYHNKFLEREAKRAEVLKRHGDPEWQAKRVEVLKRDGMLCICGDRATEVHHKTYENLGQELPSDLVALCRYCYRGIHSGEKIKLWQGSNPMNNKEYREKYLESPNWKKKRKRVLDRDNSLCVCGEYAIDVHHKTYENLGQELLSDLVALCKNCHDGYHGRLLAKSEFFWHMRDRRFLGLTNILP